MKLVEDYKGGKEFKYWGDPEDATDKDLAMGTRHNNLELMAQRLKNIRTGNTELDRLKKQER